MAIWFIGAAVVGIAGVVLLLTFFHDTPASKGVSLPGAQVIEKSSRIRLLIIRHRKLC